LTGTSREPQEKVGCLEAPRMRHDPDCGHFKWPDGTVLGVPELATEEQMRSLPSNSQDLWIKIF